MSNCKTDTWNRCAVIQFYRHDLDHQEGQLSRSMHPAIDCVNRLLSWVEFCHLRRNVMCCATRCGASIESGWSESVKFAIGSEISHCVFEINHLLAATQSRAATDKRLMITVNTITLLTRQKLVMVNLTWMSFSWFERAKRRWSSKSYQRQRTRIITTSFSLVSASSIYVKQNTAQNSTQ